MGLDDFKDLLDPPDDPAYPLEKPLRPKSEYDKKICNRIIAKLPPDTESADISEMLDILDYLNDPELVKFLTSLSPDEQEIIADMVANELFLLRGDSSDRDDISESADPDVLRWMKRFASLGNMKGYGR